MKHLTLLSTLFVLLVGQVVLGQIPQTMSYQGMLTDADGNPIADGPVSLTFKLYDAATDGTMLWQETQQVEVAGGLFNVILGSSNPLNLSFDAPYWLGISVGGDSELEPRIELTAAAYSLNSRSIADNAVSRGKIQDGAVTNAKLADNAVATTKIADNAVTGAKIASGEVVKSLNALKDDVTLSAGSNVTIQQNGNTLTISAAGGGAGDGNSLDAADGDPTDVVFVDNDGKVGVGTTSPAEKLDVVGNVHASGGFIAGNTTTYSHGQILTDEDIDITTAVTSQLYVDITNNRVGIGNKTPAEKLDVTGTVQMTGFKMPTGATSGDVLTSDASGKGTWQQAAGVGDNLGNHTATENIKLNGHWLSGDGENEGVYVRSNGYVGIGKSNPGVELEVDGITIVRNGIIVYNGIEAYGLVSANSNGSLFGVKGMHNNANFGYLGSSSYGVYGKNTNSGNYGFLGNGAVGVYGRNSSGNYGYFGGSVGAYAKHSNENYGYLGHSSYGVYGKHNSGDYYGFLGGEHYGVYGKGSWGVKGENNIEDHRGYLGTGTEGVFGHGNWGVRGEGSSRAIYGVAIATGGGYAGYFVGQGYFSGYLTKAGGGFQIDHTLDPANKYLNHSFVESSDMMNVYNGIVILDVDGEARVELPEWFDTLNKDFRYQLTAIGAPGPNLHIANEINENQFRIAGGSSGMKVSWQVTGIRNDAWAQSNRTQVEVEKEGKERGKYMHPVEHGVSETLGVDYEDFKRDEQEGRQIEEEMKKMEDEQRRIEEEHKRIEEIHRQSQNEKGLE